jgi:hypothetical protein
MVQKNVMWGICWDGQVHHWACWRHTHHPGSPPPPSHTEKTQNNTKQLKQHTKTHTGPVTTQIKDKLDSTNLYIDYTKMARITSAAATALEGSGGGSWDSEFGEARYKDFSKLWSVGIRKNVGKRYFSYMQFVDQQEERVGGNWQRLVCEAVGVPESIRFWLDVGKKVARSTINRRRQNTTNAMKKRFQGK